VLQANERFTKYHTIEILHVCSPTGIVSHFFSTNTITSS